MNQGFRRYARLYLIVLGILIAAVVIVSLAEILRVPVGACAANGASAACVRQRIVVLLPWLGMGIAIVLLVLRSRPDRGLTRTLIAASKGGSPLARLHVISGTRALTGKDIIIYSSLTTLGRDPSVADVQLYAPQDRSTVNALHCTLRYDRGQFTLTDNGSTNGTQVNGRPVPPRSPIVLRGGDEITLGDAARQGAVLRFQPAVQAVSVLPAAEPHAEDRNKTDPTLLRLVQRHLEERTREQRGGGDGMKRVQAALDDLINTASNRKKTPSETVTAISAERSAEIRGESPSSDSPDTSAPDVQPPSQRTMLMLSVAVSIVVLILIIALIVISLTA
jgi:pSer/pThr/pTyr-binding forkhead associated (FHA) protein